MCSHINKDLGTNNNYRNMQTKYFFHPDLELIHCAEGVLSCYILGTKISLFEESLDERFSSFISQYKNKTFSSQDMESFSKKSEKKYNVGKVLQELEKKALIHEKKQPITPVSLINYTDYSNKELSKLSKSADLESHLTLINNLKELDETKDNSLIFVISDLKQKHKVSELNLRFLEKCLYWCPIIMDTFGGYIGPLIHSTPAGPCFNCYQEKIYPAPPRANENDKQLPILSKLFLQKAFLEIFKASHSHLFPSQIVYSNLIEIDCLNHRSRIHYIYTNSHCSACGRL